MTFKQTPVEQVQAGDIVANHGYRMAVDRNVFDPRGNTGNQPRHILYGTAWPADEDANSPRAIRNCSFGYLVGMFAAVQS